MCAIGNDRDELGFDGGIDLDLRVRMVRIPIDVFYSLLRRIDPHFSRPGELARAIDNAGFQYARPELSAIIETRDTLRMSDVDPFDDMNLSTLRSLAKI